MCISWFKDIQGWIQGRGLPPNKNKKNIIMLHKFIFIKKKCNTYQNFRIPLLGTRLTNSVTYHSLPLQTADISSAIYIECVYFLFRSMTWLREYSFLCRLLAVTVMPLHGLSNNSSEESRNMALSRFVITVSALFNPYYLDNYKIVLCY